jgi:hypothetical protein
MDEQYADPPPGDEHAAVFDPVFFFNIHRKRSPANDHVPSVRPVLAPSQPSRFTPSCGIRRIPPPYFPPPGALNSAS